MVFICFHILGISSSQLTNSYFSEGYRYTTNQIYQPSGYLTVRHGKSQFLIGKYGKPSISMGHLYHGFVSHNQRVDGQISPPTLLTTVQGGGVHRHWHGRHLHVGGLLFAQLLAHVAEHDRRHGGVRVWWGFLGHTERLVNDDLGMDQYLLIPFLGG